MTEPTVSVVLPARNREQSLGRAIASVLDQSFGDLELIVVDDGSSDGTRDLIASTGDPRVVPVRLEGQNGPAVARNAGIARARGRLIAFQDSDDQWDADKLKRQVALLDANSTVGGVGGAYAIDSPEGQVTVRSRALEAGQDYERDVLEGPCCITPVWVLRREVLDQVGGFDETLPCLEDWDLMLRVSDSIPLMAVPELVLTKYGSPDSLGGDIERRLSALTTLEQRYGDRWRRHQRDAAKLRLELIFLNATLRRRRAAAKHLTRGLVQATLKPHDLVRLAVAWRSARSGGPKVWPSRG